MKVCRILYVILFSAFIALPSHLMAATPPALHEGDEDSSLVTSEVEIPDTTPIPFKIRTLKETKVEPTIATPTFPEAYNVIYDTVHVKDGEIFTDIIPEYSDSIIIERLKALKLDIPIEGNKYVLQWIKHYTTVGRNVPKAALGRSPYYYPLFEQIFAEEGIPDQVKHLSIIESGLKPYAKSRSGALGLWQFMHATGKYLDMKISYYIDDRKDVIESTKHAAGYLNKLHDSFDDWLIAIASYNCGPGTMRKAIRKSGYKKTFWEVRPYLPPETRNYVPALLAMTYCMNYPEEHAFTPTEPTRYHCNINYQDVDVVHVKEQLSFETLSGVLDIPAKQLAFLNPGLKRNMIPFTRNGYELKIPCNKVPLYHEMRDSMILMEIDRIAALGMNYSFDKEHAYYRIEPGDNLGYIAKKHDCTVKELMKWNNLTSSSIRAGKRLIVYKGLNLPEHSAYRQAKKTPEKKNISSDPSVVFYTIESGDTLWAISKKFPGTSIDSLRRENKIYDTKNLIPGTIIKVTSTI